MNNNTFGTHIINGSLINLSSHNKGWNLIPKKYKTRDNYDMFCYLNYWGVDALSSFLEKIKEHETPEDFKKILDNIIQHHHETISL